jgi:saccharopine dehydrogenase (NAD+, L-lysine-forming)
LRISVLGIGAQGSVIAKLLSDSPDVSEVVCADVNVERIMRLKARLKSDKITVLGLDAAKREDLAKATKGMNLVVNALPGFNLRVMGAALESGAHYIDLASNYPVLECISEQLELDTRWKNAGLAAVIEMGSTPGVSNMMARYASDRLDSVEEIHVKCGWKDLGETEAIVKPWSPGWSPEIALLDYANEPIIFEDGQLKTVPIFSGIEKYEFPSPVKEQVLSWHIHEEPVTLSKFIGKGVNYVDFKYPVDPIAAALIKMNFASQVPVDVKGAKVAPLDVFVKLAPEAPETVEEVDMLAQGGVSGRVVCLIVDVLGKKNGKKVTHSIYTNSDTREMFRKFCTSNIDVALPAAITALMIVRGDLNVKGVLVPECLPPEPILTELSNRGIQFYEKVTREL